MDMVSWVALIAVGQTDGVILLSRVCTNRVVRELGCLPRMLLIMRMVLPRFLLGPFRLLKLLWRSTVQKRGVHGLCP